MSRENKVKTTLWEEPEHATLPVVLCSRPIAGTRPVEFMWHFVPRIRFFNSVARKQRWSDLAKRIGPDGLAKKTESVDLARPVA